MIKSAMGCDIAIVGGGIYGSLVAYFLSQTGAKTVVVEKGELGGQTSGYNSGTLGPLLGSGLPGPMSEPALAAFDLHRQMFDVLGAERPETFRPLTRLHVIAGEKGRSRLDHVLEQYRRQPGFTGQRLQGAELLRVEPRLNPKFTEGVLTHGDLAVDGREYTQAVVSLAKRNNATFVNDCASDFETRGDRVTAVRCLGQTISCQALIIAAGPWSGALARQLDCDISLKIIKGEMLHFVSPPPACDISAGGMSCYGRGRGHVWAGCTSEEAGFDLSPTQAARSRVREAAAEMLPDLEQAEIDSQTVALRDVGMDGFPVFGNLPGWSNAYIMCGGGSKGLLLSTLMARGLTDLLDGTTDRTTLQLGDPGRFAENAA